MDYNYEETPSTKKFPVWIIVVLLVILCLCLGTAALIGVVVSNDEFQDEMSELFDEGIVPSNELFTPMPTVEADETAVSSSSTPSASAVKKTPVPTSPAVLATDMDSLQAAIAAYSEADLNTLPIAHSGETAAMKHDLEDYIKTVDTGVDVTDFVADALFQNPFAASESSWDIGYAFHRQEVGDELWIIINSEGEWELMERTGGDGVTIDSGVVNGRLHLNANEANRLTLIAKGKKGYFLVNNELVARLDLSSRTDGGEVLAATAYYTGHEIDGVVTKVENFTIWDLD